jgi:membrane fusion protein (multidrug efflux system)
VDFALPQQQAQTLMNHSVRITTESGSQISARVIARDAAINPESRQLSFRALLPNADSRLFPGTLVSVEVPLGNASNVLVVPASAVRRNALGATVYTIEQTNETGEQTVERAVRRSVTVGVALDFDDITQQQLVIVTSGLNLGERIAANGAFKLRDGSKLKVRETGVRDTSTRTTEGGRG